MHVRVLAVAGKPAEWVRIASEKYLQRLPRAWRTKIEIIAPARTEVECERILKRVADDEWLVLLDERGKSLTSTAVAKQLQTWLGQSRDICFLIGGASGVNQAVRDRANFTLSLSKMTMPHELARVVLIEQLYRAQTIIDGHPYHRE